MLRGYWRIIIAVAGLVLLGAAPPEKRAENAQPTKAIEPPAPPQARYAPYPDRYAESCYQAKDHDTADLCAQWRAATAAEEAADTAWWGNLVGAIAATLSLASVFLVVIALRQTEKSLTIAQRDRASATRRAIASEEETKVALTIAERSAAAGVKLAEISELTARNQLRAYVSVKSIRHIEPLAGREKPKLQIEILNHGQTPGRINRMNVDVAWCVKDAQPLLIESVEQPFDHDSFQGTPIITPVSIPRDIDEVEKVRVLLVVGTLKYTDVFGESHSSVFKFQTAQRTDYYGIGDEIELVAIAVAAKSRIPDNAAYDGI